MPRFFLLLLVASVVLTATLTVGCAESDPVYFADADTTAVVDSIPADEPIFDIRSVTLDARSRPDPSLLVHLRDLGVTHLTLVSFGWQSAVDEPSVRVDTTDGWYSESHTGIRRLAQQADTLGMGIILKPHLWVGGYDEEQERSQIGFDTESEWRQWEAQYREFLLEYARLAAEVEADVLVLGTELRRSATTRPAFWRELAAEVRTVYGGQLTYAANWHEEYEAISFWDALDYVGVQAYFPLSGEEAPSLATLQDGWRSHRKALAKVQERTHRPVLFTEIGYRSAPSAASRPWEWPERDTSAEATDPELQARCYRAFFSTVARADWLAGAIVWKWHPVSEGDRPTGFTPQNKPAEQVLRRWFTGRSCTSS